MGVVSKPFPFYSFVLENSSSLLFFLILGHNTEVAVTSACIEVITDKTYSDPNLQQRCDQKYTWN